MSTLSDFSHYSLDSSSSSLHRTKTRSQSCHLRCDPSIINFLSHNLLTTHRSELFLDEIDDQDINESSTHVPLAESSRRTACDHDQTLVAEEEDERAGPLTSTLVDRWYTITRGYTAAFRQDLTVRKNESVQVLRCSHPHWVFVRNEGSVEGFVPTDCLTFT